MTWTPPGDVTLYLSLDCEDINDAKSQFLRARLLLRFRWVLVLLACAWFSRYALAVPSFARQTGLACKSCHVQSFGPNLTPYGREFKLNGYVTGESGFRLPPIAVMVKGSFTHTDEGIPSGAAPRFHANNNVSLDEASLFYAGRILSKVGAFAQLTYSGIDDRLAIDNTDLRFADQASPWGQDLVYGISLNNSPTVQDLWNSTPVWGFPFANSELAPAPTATTLVDETLAQQVGGATAYLMWNNLLYLEAGAYATFSKRFLTATGIQAGGQTDGRHRYGGGIHRRRFIQYAGQNQIDGGAPYWRVALQHDFNGHYLAIGTFGRIGDKSLKIILINPPERKKVPQC